MPNDTARLGDGQPSLSTTTLIERSIVVLLVVGLLLGVLTVLWLRWTPSVGQESGGAKRESHRVPTPLPIRGEV